MVFACSLIALALAGVAAARFVAADGESPTAPGLGETGSTGGSTDTGTTDTSSTIDTTTAVAADTTAPTIEITLPADGTTYVAGRKYPAAYTCEDEAGGSGLDACVGTVNAGAAIDTITPGDHAFTVEATDKAGNETTSTVHYAVAYAFAGFGDPLASQAGRDQEPGRAIPITFSLGADLGLNVLADGFPASRPCGGGALEPIGSPGDSALQYDAGAQQYVIVWKTSRDWAGSCRELVVRLRDGSEQSVEVTFRATPAQGPLASPPGQDKDKEKGKGKPETPGHGHAP